MFNHHLSTMTFSSKRFVVLSLIALATLGQSCSVSFGNSQPKDGGIYRTDDKGATWRQKTFIRTEKKQRIGLDDATITSLQIDPKNPDQLYAGVRGLGLWKSTNRGERWAVTGLKTGNLRCLSFDPKSDQILYLASGNQIRKSLNQGKTWAVIYNEPQAGQTIECVAVDQTRENVLWSVTTGGKVLRSTDFGANWTLVNTVRKLTGIIRMEVDQITNGLTIFTSRRGIHRLDASGVQATDISAPLDVYSGGRKITDVEIVSDNNGTTWYLATAYGILASADGGAQWREISTLLNPNSTSVGNIAVNPKNSSEIFITTGRRLHRTTDGGASWAVTNLPSTRQPVWLLFDRVNPDRLYVGTFITEKK